MKRDFDIKLDLYKMHRQNLMRRIINVQLCELIH